MMTHGSSHRKVLVSLPSSKRRRKARKERRARKAKRKQLKSEMIILTFVFKDLILSKLHFSDQRPARQPGWFLIACPRRLPPIVSASFPVCAFGSNLSRFLSTIALVSCRSFDSTLSFHLSYFGGRAFSIAEGLLLSIFAYFFANASSSLFQMRSFYSWVSTCFTLFFSMLSTIFALWLSISF